MKQSDDRVLRDHVMPYEHMADLRVAEYDSLDPDEIYAGLLPYLPLAGAAVLDVGAGSGRDALWLAKRGYRVVAVEPAPAMRRHIADKAKGRNDIDVRDGLLPDLVTVTATACFDLILLGAVWQHVPPRHRIPAMHRMAACLAPGGILFMLLREGPAPAGRKMYRTGVAATARMARGCGLDIITADTAMRTDMLARADVSWAMCIARKPLP